MKSMFLFLLFSCYCYQLFGQHRTADSNTDRLIQGKVTGLNIKRSTPEHQNQKPLNKEELFEQILSYSKVSINFDSGFYVVDSNFSFFAPMPATTNAQGIQILRSFAKHADPHVVIGLFVCPGSVDSMLNHAYWASRNTSHPDLSPRDRELDKVIRLMNGYDRFYKKNSCSHLSLPQLRKINADHGSGIIYEITISDPFKGKYDKCKILAAKNAEGDYLSLYYFYHDINDKKITRLINSQLGMVKFQ